MTPRKIASDAISLLSVKAKEKAIELKLEIDDSVPSEIVTDPTRLHQILLNLVGNAVKFTQKGSVALHAFGSRSDLGKEFVSFEISDTGIGIAASQTSRIFDLFVQADGSTTRKFGGTGLGLTLSRSLARSMGGDLQLVKSEEGKGSVFQATIENRVDMRVRTEVQPGELTSTMPALPEKALNGLNILVVDDSPDNQQLLLRSLAKQGAIVELASDGSEALEKATFGNHDIVLMDIQMPVMDGYTATQKLRDRGYAKPIVALTAHAMTEVRRKSLNVGCNAHLTKPINSKELVRTIVQLT